jgi:hypothetical protein
MALARTLNDCNLPTILTKMSLLTAEIALGEGAADYAVGVDLP